jgi:hypothetical protein
MTEDCAHPEHPAGCESCRAFAESLGDEVDVRPITVKTLPMAAWEGAAHRSWPLLIAAAGGLLIAAMAVLAVAGLSPLELFHGRVPSLDILMSMATMAGGAVQNAPRTWQVAILVGFVVINAIFVALLRRAPKGIDV